MNFTQACWRSALSTLALGVALIGPAVANPTLVVDAASGEVLYKDMATAPWFPASTTKLMTVYVALSKVKEGRISLNTPLRVSAYAASMEPSKMGFRPGTLVTLDNALKMLMVKSPNDIAVTIAEGISGSVPAFAEEMNAYGQRLGLHESHFANPNGLPDPNHYSSARDMAMIARGLIREFPEEQDLFNIGALQFGGKLIPNHNGLLGRYPGVDGMKTGYTCSAGYNVVESATRGDRRLLVVIMGAPSTNERNLRAVSLFEKYFSNPGSGLGNVADLPQSDVVAPPDMRGQICGPGRHNAIQEAEAEDAAILPASSAPAAAVPLFGRAPERADVVNMAATPATALGGLAALLHARDAVVPVRVFVGPAPGTDIAAVGAIEEAVPGPGARAIGRAAAADAAKDGTGAPALAQAVDPSDPTVGTVAPLALAGAATPAALAAANKVVKGHGRLMARPSRGGHAPTAAPAKAEPKAVAVKPQAAKPQAAKPKLKASQSKAGKAAPAAKSRVAAKPPAKGRKKTAGR
ncbi:D-alanyl-D-alanine carboxypeptidase family protein [Lichenibacterium ramalinae]|nr:D-alanyl-D-alanine carboxypeptidase family protein [Lichenibacterium ramalinae]